LLKNIEKKNFARKKEISREEITIGTKIIFKNYIGTIRYFGKLRELNLNKGL
jgi:hypothetical protein